MNTRKHTTAFGHTFDVPKHVVRLDGTKVRGWQLRFGTWTLFSDHSNDGSGSEAALHKATQELARRMQKLPVRGGVRTDPLRKKSSGLPLGISKAERRKAAGGIACYYYQVTYPVFGGKPANKNVYIATANTLTLAKQQQALAKAMAMRTEGERVFQQKRMRQQRQDAKQMLAQVRHA